MTQIEEYKQIKLVQIIDECDKHISKIIFDINSLSEHIPLTVEKYNSMQNSEISLLDQFIFRFSKLQDCMGEKLFKTLLDALEENIKNKTFIDILNRLEELELINVNEWKSLRELRNIIAHEYSSECDEIVETLNKLFKEFNNLYSFFINIKNYIINNNLCSKILAASE